MLADSKSLLTRAGWSAPSPAGVFSGPKKATTDVGWRPEGGWRGFWPYREDESCGRPGAGAPVTGVLAQPLVRGRGFGFRNKVSNLIQHRMLECLVPAPSWFSRDFSASTQRRLAPAGFNGSAVRRGDDATQDSDKGGRRQKN